MSLAITKTVRASKSEVPLPSPSHADLDRLGDDRRSVVRPNHSRHQSNRRRFVDPTACERDYAVAEREFMQAMEEYKQRSGRMFPTWSEVLEVLCSLGYEKTSGGDELRNVRTEPAGMGPGPHVKPGQSDGKN